MGKKRGKGKAQGVDISAKQGLRGRNMNAGQRFMIRSEFMRIQSARDGAAPEPSHEPVTL